jgi:hypothetical protein
MTVRMGLKWWKRDGGRRGLTCGDVGERAVWGVGLALSNGVEVTQVATKSATPRPVVEHLAGGHFRSALPTQRLEGGSMVPALRLLRKTFLVTAPGKIAGGAL